MSSGGSGKLMTKKKGRILLVTRSDKDDSSEGRSENWMWREKRGYIVLVESEQISLAYPETSRR